MSSAWNAPDKDPSPTSGVHEAYASPAPPETTDAESLSPLFALEKRYGVIYLVMLASWVISDLRFHDLLAGRGLAISDPGAGTLLLRIVGLAAVYAMETTAAWLLVLLLTSPEKRSQLQFGHWYLLGAALTHSLRTLILRSLLLAPSSAMTGEDIAAFASRQQSARLIGLAAAVALFVWAWARVPTIQRWPVLFITLSLSHVVRLLIIGLMFTLDPTRFRDLFDLWGIRLFSTAGMLSAIAVLALFGYAVQALVLGKRLDWLCWLGVLHPVAMIARELLAPGWG